MLFSVRTVALSKPGLFMYYSTKQMPIPKCLQFAYGNLGSEQNKGLSPR